MIKTEKRKVKYLLIFERLKNLHLIKDVGVIPYFFHQKFNFDSTILTYQNEKEYPYLNEYCKGLKLKILKRRSIIFPKLSLELPIIYFLVKNSRKYDFLELYHLTNSSMIYFFLYKLLNPQGFAYLKTDALEDIKYHNKIKSNSYQNYRLIKRKNFFTNVINRIISVIFKKISVILLNRIDLMSIESKDIYNIIKDYSKIKDKIVYIPIGIDDNQVKSLGIHRIPFKERENIILTVGRLGTFQKATEVLLEAIPKVKILENWKIILIGSIELKFKKYIYNFFEKYPHLRNNVLFTGNISDRKKFLEYYQKSKIFCLPSRFESFGIVLVEAGYFGNNIVSSNISTAREITNNGKFGKLFKIGNSNELAKILQYLVNNERFLKENCPKIQNYIEKNFLWKNIVLDLYNEIFKRKKLNK
jgi:glycosyltransferase involved in cell wall biosynthesis